MMLSSTADHLYWMARSMERAENTARMLDVTFRISLMKNSAIAPNQHWSAILSISGLNAEYAGRFDGLSAENVIYFMALDASNPASIYNSIFNARENARAVRGSISAEMWETINATWLEIKDMPVSRLMGDRASVFFDWVKERSHLSRGVTFGTMLRDDGFRFVRIGAFLERADNTARILDVKYHILLPSIDDVGGAADYYQWGSLLRSVSAFAAYRKIYKDTITPTRVAELLILRADMPRSLAMCMHEVNRLMVELGGERAGELLRQCGLLEAELRHGRIEEVLAIGLHEYLTGFLERLYRIGELINQTYFWSVDE
jgi:uncharacterized alpha-E superfamily protein